MATGRYRHRFELQEARASKGPFGNRVEAWETVGAIYGRVRLLPTRETQEGGTRRLEQPAELVVPWHPRVRPGARLLELAEPPTVYRIESAIDVEGRGREMVITATAYLHQGDLEVAP